MKIKWKNTIRVKVTLVYVAIVTIILVVTGSSFRNMLQHEAIGKSTALCKNTLQNISVAIDSKLFFADDYRYLIHSDQTMMKALAQILPIDQRTNYQQYVYQNNIRKGLVGYSYTSNFVDSFFLYSFMGETFFSSKNRYFIINNIQEKDCSLVQSYEQSSNKNWILYRYPEEDESLIINFQPIYDFYTNEKLGIFSINISLRTIIEDISTRSPQEDMQIVVTDSLGNNIILPREIPSVSFFRKIEEHPGNIITIDKKEYLIVKDTSNYTDWTFYAILPLSTVLSSTTYINDVFIMTFFIVLIAFFTAALVGGIYLYKPIKNIFNAMKKVEAGDLSIQIESNRTDEVGYIIHRFNQTISSLNKQIHENYVNKLLLREAQLINIYSQIDEHFLYNTLDAIKWAATFCDPRTISQTVVSLSKYYRISLSDGRDFITVRESIEQTEAYLQIQKFRMQNTLNYSIEVDPEALDLHIIKYIMQPLVENCVIHGIRKSLSNGHILIHINRKSDKLYFKISDNGAGIPPSILDDIKMHIRKDNAEKTKYFALHTVNLLLKTFYSSRCNLNIESREGVGTDFLFEIPITNSVKEPSDV